MNNITKIGPNSLGDAPTTVSMAFTVALAIAVAMAFVSPIILAEVAQGQDEFQSKQLTHEDYDRWNTLGQTSISDDGKWVMFATSPGKGNPRLIVREITSARQFRVERASTGQFSTDSRFVVAIIRPDEEEVEKLRKQKTKPEDMPQPRLAILDLHSGQQESVERVQSFNMPSDFPGWLTYTPIPPKPADAAKEEKSELHSVWQVTPEGLVESKGETSVPSKEAKPAEKDVANKKEKARGQWLVLRNLATGEERRYPDTTSHTFSQNGRWLAYAASAPDEDRDGVFVVRMSDGQRTQIISGRGRYQGLSFDEQEKRLVFTSDRDNYGPEKPSLAMYLWHDWQKQASRIVDEQSAGMPAGWWLANGTPLFTEDGRRILFNTQPKPEDAGKTKEELEKEKKAAEAEGPRAKLDLWHWQDPQLQPQQLLSAARERNRTYRAAFLLKQNKMVQLATPELKSVMVDPRSNADFAIGIDQEKYLKLRSWESPGFMDMYLVDLNTGASKLVHERLRGMPSMSPAGTYVTWWDPDALQQKLLPVTATSLDDQSTEARVISDGIPTSLANELHDTPQAPRSYGVAGWLDGDEALLLYDRFDLWQVDPLGKAAPKCVTAGLGRQPHDTLPPGSPRPGSPVDQPAPASIHLSI